MTNDNIPLPSLDKKVRNVIDDFNFYFTKGSTIRNVFINIKRRRNISYAEIKKILEQELGIKVGGTREFMKKLYKQDQAAPTIGLIINNEEKLK